MKFTPEQVKQLLAESGANCVRSNPSKADEVYEAYFYELARLCTLAADRALEAAAAKADEPGVYTRHDMQSAIRAMKEHQ